VRIAAAVQTEGLFDKGSQAYSDSNPPLSLERTFGATPAAPPANESVEWTTDGKSLDMRAPDGTTTRIGPSAGGGGAANFPLFAVLTADFVSSVISVAGISGLSLTLAANTRYLVVLTAVYTAAATGTGVTLGLAGTAQTGLTGIRVATALQNTTTAVTRGLITTPTGTHAVTTSPGAIPGIMEAHAVFTTGATGGTFMFSAGTEVAASAVTILAGAYMEARVL
jgi:hypothetical protein